MSEIGGGYDDGDEIGTTGGETNEDTTASVGETNTESEATTPAIEAASASKEGTSVTVSNGETKTSELGEAQKSVEGFHTQSVAQIFETNGKYMTDADKERVAAGLNSIKAVEHDPSKGRTGGYSYHNGKSSIEVSAISKEQMERTTKHETNHFMSHHKENTMPDPKNNGTTVFNTVGFRHSSWFRSDKTGEISNYTERGRGMNEGMTTMLTNEQLAQLDAEKGKAAERQQIYANSTELMAQLESIVGKDTVRGAYFGGNNQALESEVNRLAGDKEYDRLVSCLDRTLSRDAAERVSATKEAQEILARMSERSKKA